MSIANQYIGTLVDIWGLDDKAKDKLYSNTDKIDEAFDGYGWGDINHAISIYYTRKSDKTYPKIAQILAILEANNAERIESIADTLVTNTQPKTKLFAIRDTFDRMIQVLTDAGVLPDDNGKLHNTVSIVDPISKLPLLNPGQWLKWKLADAEKDNPQIFAPYPYTTFYERLALAIQNKLILFSVRDWSKQGACHV